jgi:hypothetical protein
VTDAVEFQALFEDVRDQLHQLHTSWTLYLCLYGEKGTVELLRATAIVTFGALQSLLIQVMYIETGRLLDPSPSRGHRTASMERLIHSLPPSAARLGRRLRKGLKSVRRACKQLIRWRDTQVVHRNEATVLREDTTPLAPGNMQSLSEAIEYFADALTEISDELRLNLPYDMHREMSNLDVHKLIRRLQDAQDAHA